MAQAATAPTSTPPVRRDRARTERRLLEAASALLVEEGFHAVRVNAVAQRAGVDKVLLYRYFGDVEGLLAGLAEREVLLPPVEDFLKQYFGAVYAGQHGLLLAAWLTTLKARPLTRAALLALGIHDNALTRAARQAAAVFWVEVGEALELETEARRTLEVLALGLLLEGRDLLQARGLRRDVSLENVPREEAPAPARAMARRVASPPVRRQKVSAPASERNGENSPVSADDPEAGDENHLPTNLL